MAGKIHHQQILFTLNYCGRHKNPPNTIVSSSNFVPVKEVIMLTQTACTLHLDNLECYHKLEPHLCDPLEFL